MSRCPGRDDSLNPTCDAPTCLNHPPPPHYHHYHHPNIRCHPRAAAQIGNRPRSTDCSPHPSPVTSSTVAHPFFFVLPAWSPGSRCTLGIGVWRELGGRERERLIVKVMPGKMIDAGLGLAVSLSGGRNV